MYISHGVKRNVDNVWSFILKFPSISRSLCYYFLKNQIKSVQYINIKFMRLYKEKSPLFNMPFLQIHKENIFSQILYVTFLNF